MISFTLDTNCIVDVDEGREQMTHILRLVKAHNDGRADVALVASSASERQRDGGFLGSFRLFQERIAGLGFGKLPALPAILYFDISFWDVSILADEIGKERERAIFRAIHPKIHPYWPDYAAAHGVDLYDLKSPRARKWRNALCDVQAFWAHDYAKRDVFVTRDTDFDPLKAMPEFASTRILPADEAAALI